MMDNEQLITRQQNHFEKIAAAYHSARSQKKHLLVKQMMWELFWQRNREQLSGFDSPVRVLEPMCGFGDGYDILINSLPEVDFTYAGFDSSSTLVSQANRQRPRLAIRCGDVTCFHPGDQEESYDMILLISGLHHVHSMADEVVACLQRALKPGGLFISLEPTHNFFLQCWIRDRIYATNNLFDDATEKGFSLNQLNTLFIKNRFCLIDQIYPGLLAYTLYYNPDAFPFLARAPEGAVRSVFTAERWAMSRWPGRKMSFATLSLFQKVEPDNN